MEDLEKASLRAQLLQSAEDGLRQSLKQLATNFEVADLQNKISNEKLKLINTDAEGLKTMEDRLTTIFTDSAVSEKDRNEFFRNSEE